VKWFEDGTGLLVLGTLEGEKNQLGGSTIRCAVALPIVRQLPSRTLDASASIADVVTSMCECFLTKVGPDGADPEFIFSGRMTPEEIQQKISITPENMNSSEGLWLISMSRDSGGHSFVDYWVCIRLEPLREWYFEHVFPKLSQAVRLE
jgi:hypothetical protein